MQSEPWRFVAFPEETSRDALDMTTMSLVWHYTALIRFPAIYASRFVDVSRRGFSPPQLPVAWFSADQYWERTVRFRWKKSVGENPWNLREMYVNGLFAARIGVAPSSAPLNWTAIRIQAHISTKTARQLVQVADECGADPRDWFGSRTPVPRREWQSIQSFNGTEWSEVLPNRHDKGEPAASVALG